ncbi:MAG: hypothetical protein Q9168_003734 [Polycauliona sp. 1 TL-2023]
MAGAGKYKVRPLKVEGSDLKKILKVNLSARALTIHGLKPDDWCQLSSAAGLSFLVQVWPAPANAQDTWIQVTDDLRHRHNLNLGDEVYLSRCPKPNISNADEVVASECQQNGRENHGQEDTGHWAWHLDYELEQAGMLCPGMIFNLCARGEERAFRIDSINKSDRMVPCRYAARPKLTITHDKDHPSAATTDEAAGRPAKIEAAALGGLDTQVARLNSVIAKYGPSADLFKFRPNHRQRRGGVILHGPSGTGKSKLLRMAAELGLWNKVYHMEDTMKGAAIRQVFEEAHRCQPSIIIIDDLDYHTPKTESAYDSQSSDIVKSLCKGLDARDNNRVLVLAAARNLALVHESLRHPGRFQTEIDIPVPGTDARAQILSLASGLKKDSKDEQLLWLADSTHGYVGSDLEVLLDTAMNQGSDRLRASNDDKPPKISDHLNSEVLTHASPFTRSDFESALLLVEPTAMKEIFLDIPKAIEWPLKYGLEMEQQGLRPQKGLLLYGPPGCSKTLVAKAVATETKLNFIAVKGAEFLSMYVGESERALRNLFRKARGAAPSILFFDEIDAIGASRAKSPQGGLQVLTTLLNELDGIEALRGVFVLAATNQPHILDPALLRPGRLESSLYVGLPDDQTRSDIVAMQTKGMSLGPDFDAAVLVKATEGHSGAEIVDICRQAGYAALDESLARGQGPRFVITMKHVSDALERATKQVTPEVVRGYEEWRDRGQVKVGHNEQRGMSNIDRSVEDVLGVIAQLLLHRHHTD